MNPFPRGRFLLPRPPTPLSTVPPPRPPRLPAPLLSRLAAAALPARRPSSRVLLQSHGSRRSKLAESLTSIHADPRAATPPLARRAAAHLRRHEPPPRRQRAGGHAALSQPASGSGFPASASRRATSAPPTKARRASLPIRARLIGSLSLLPMNESRHFSSNPRSKFRSFALLLNAQTTSVTRDNDGAGMELDRTPSMKLPTSTTQFHLMAWEP